MPRGRVVGADRANDREPVETGHADVENGDRRPVLERQVERLVAVARLDHLEAVAAQPRRRSAAGCRRRRPATRTSRAFAHTPPRQSHVVGGLRRRVRGQLDPERRAPVDVAHGRDPAAVRLGDRAGDVQAEPGARELVRSRRSVRGRSGRTAARHRADETPMPVSLTSSTPPSDDARHAHLDVASGGVNLIALEMRFSSSWKSRPLSAATVTGPSALQLSERPFAVARGCASSTPARNRGQVELRPLELQPLAGLKARDEEQIVDQTQQPLRARAPRPRGYERRSSSSGGSMSSSRVSSV